MTNGINNEVSEGISESVPRPKCGIIMPISAIDGYSETHWLEVRGIVFDVIDSVGFDANLVSDAEDVGIIQKRIIQNLYENPIVVCDVSGKNPNVMFELGMRLAFDKATIIIKDDVTTYSFDTSPIEHLEYPRDLRYNQIVKFKEDLRQKIEATFHKSVDDPSYTTFLKHFGTFKVAQIESKEVSKEDYILEELQDLKQLVISRTVLERRSEPENLVTNSRTTRTNAVLKAVRDAIKYFDENREPTDREKIRNYVDNHFDVSNYFASYGSYIRSLDFALNLVEKGL